MGPRVVLVGHCGADGRMLCAAVRRAAPEAVVVHADDQASLDAEIPRASLLLINRVLGSEYAHEVGVDLIREIASLDVAPKPVTMLVSNYEDAQAAAERAGAKPGFGKQDLNTPKVADRLRAALNGATSEGDSRTA